GAAPKLQTTVRRALVPDAIDGRDIHAIGNGMGALDQLPSLVLSDSEFRLLTRMPADCRRIEENRGPLESGQASALRKPLIPAHQDTDPTKPRIENPKPEISRREIILLVVKRVVRNVHFAIEPEQAAVGIEHHGSIMVDPRRAPLKER